MQRKILITGGAGFIGSCLAEKLIEDDSNEVVLVDNLLTGKIQNLPKNTKKNWKFIKADVNDFKEISSIMLSFSFDYVFHYAAVVGVKRTQEHPVMVLHDIKGIENILNLSKNTCVKRVFFSSSSEVYGEPTDLPQNEETTPLNSRIPYAVVKNVGESFLKSYNKEFGLDYTIFRFFNTYGSKQSTDFVMSRFMSLALQNQDITIYGDGLQSRTFCYIDDNIDATLSTLDNNCCINEIVNIGSDKEMHIIDLAQLIIEVTGSQSKIIHLPPLAEGDMIRRLPDVTKMNMLLKRNPIPIKEGIAHTFANPLFH